MPTDNELPEDDEFNAGFTEEVTLPTPTPAADDDAGEPEGGKVTEPEHKPDTDPVTQEPKYVQITEDELQRLRSAATAIDEIKAESKRQFDSAFGKIGGMQQLLDQLKSQTPSGQAVEITEEDFAELKAEWPEMADLSLKGFQRVLSKLKGTGTPTATIDVDKLVAERVAPEVEKVRQEYRSEITDLRMQAHHKDWKTVLNSDDFIAWEKTLPKDELEKFSKSSDPEVVADFITKFKAAKVAADAKAKKDSTRQELIEAAVTPRGTGGHAPAPSEDDDFDAGFKSG